MFIAKRRFQHTEFLGDFAKASDFSEIRMHVGSSGCEARASRGCRPETANVCFQESPAGRSDRLIHSLESPPDGDLLRPQPAESASLAVPLGHPIILGPSLFGVRHAFLRTRVRCLEALSTPIPLRMT